MAFFDRMRSLFGVFMVALVVALGVRVFLLEDYRITSVSMAPNLMTGDLVFVSKSAFNLKLPFSAYELFRFRSPRRGEVIAFNLPGRGSDTYVKRVVAVEGDRLQIKKGEIFLNNAFVKYRKTEVPAALRQVASPPLTQVWESLGEGEEHLIRPDPKGEYGPIDIPKGTFFALGDNRPESLDGRSWGPVPLTALKGRVSYIWLSVDPKGSLRPGRAGTPIP